MNSNLDHFINRMKKFEVYIDLELTAAVQYLERHS